MSPEAMWNTEVYHPVNRWAVVAFVLAGMTAAGFLIPVLTGLALLSVVSAFVALHGISRYEMSGRWLALSGVGLSLILVAVIPTWHVVQFRAEAPAGVVRLDFKEVTSADESDRGLEQYIGQRVCLKGYAFPPEHFVGLTTFIMSADGDFGSNATTVEVNMSEPQTWNWTINGQAATGMLLRNPNFVEGGTMAKWILHDSEVRPTSSLRQLAYSRRSNIGC